MPPRKRSSRRRTPARNSRGRFVKANVRVGRKRTARRRRR